jgi:CSLREA domain-containing protein
MFYTRRPTSRSRNRLSSAQLRVKRFLRFDHLEDRTVPATITVTGVGDSIGVDGVVTLREAIQSINAGANLNADVVADTNGGAEPYGTMDKIIFSSLFDMPQIIVLNAALAQIDITKALTIAGKGPNLLTIDGNGAVPTATSRIFNINVPDPATITLSGMTLTGGRTSTGNNGGAILLADETLVLDNTVMTLNIAGTSGGAIATTATGAVISIGNSTISNNFSVGAGGGAIFTAASATATITLTNSNMSGNFTVASATGGGAILGSASTTFSATNSVFHNNSATIGASLGGAVRLSGTATVTVNGSVFSSNIASSNGAGIYVGGVSSVTMGSSTFSQNLSSASGGGFYLAGNTTLTLTSCIFSDNTSTIGGGFRTAGTTTVMTMDSCTLSGNLATSTLGGGCYIGNGGTITINASTFYNNVATTGGGAIRFSTHQVTINNSTFSGNIAKGTAATAGGGAIIHTSTPGGTGFTMRNSTVVNNEAVGSSSVRGGGIFINSATGTVTLNSNIIANNKNDHGDFGASAARTVLGTKNLFGFIDTSVYTINVDNQNGSSTATPLDPKVQALGNYGGPTLTHIPRVNSPAINAGNNVSPTLGFDQRGVARPGDTTQTDIGAVEGVSAAPFVSSMAVVGSVTSSSDTVTVTVTYEDETGINLSSLGSNDLVLKGPGTPASIALTSVVPDPMNKVVVATYQITGPGGLWRAIDSGLHSVWIAANSVLDIDGTPNALTAQALGTFTASVAGVIVVDNAGDGIDGNVGVGQVTLREAVAAANFTVGGANTITFDSVALNGATITLTTGQLFITDAVTIAGLGSNKLAISGLPNVPSTTNRIFNVNIPGGTALFEVNGVTLTGCNVFAGGVNGGVITLGDDQLVMDDVRIVNNFGASIAAAGIAVSAALTTLGNNITATNCAFINNVVASANTGGAIVAAAAGVVLFFDNCVFDSNATGGNGGAIGATGANTTITVMKSVFTNNTSGTGSGGGAINTAGVGTAIAITDSTISMNSAGTGGGGGINVAGNSSTLTIDGSVLSGNFANSFGGALRTPTTTPAATVNLTNSVFTNNSTTQSGGALQAGSTTNLIIAGSTFKSNTAANSGGALNLGSGNTTIGTSDFQNNSAGALGGAINFGAAGNYTLVDSVVKNNSATTSGGGIHAVNNSTSKIERTTISGNTAGDLGGGFASAGGSVTILASTLSGNSAGNGGGGASFTIAAATGIEITNSTVSGNQATGMTAIGGGVHTNATGAGTLNINNSTITRNTAVGNGGGLGFATNTATVTIVSSIVAQNVNAVHPDLFSTPTTPLVFPNVSHSIIGAVTDTDLDLSSGFGNVTGTLGSPINAKLTPLGNYGGPTQTHGPSMGSPALNSGSNPLSLTTDQRGQPRPVDPTLTDIGSFEGELNIPTATVTKMDNVTVAGGTTYDIVVVYADPTNNINTGTIGLSDVTLSGPGYMTPAAPSSFMISGSGGSVTVTYTFTPPGGSWDLTDNGKYTLTVNENEVSNTAMPALFVQPGAIGSSTVSIATTYVVDKLGDVDDGNYGPGQLTLREAVKLANEVSVLATDTITFDSGVFTGQTIALTGGQLTITDPVVIVGLGSGKLTISGAATASATNRIFNVAVAGGTVNLSGLRLTGGNLTAGNGGAMLVAAGTIVATDMVFANNRTVNGGGAVGISAVSKDHTFTDCVFIDNAAGGNVGGGTVSGGGMITTSTGIGLTLNGCVFHNNFGGGGLGGGLATVGSTTVTINDSVFTRNRAYSEGGGLQGGSTINLTINNSLFANNESGTRGGGINVGSGTTTINNTRILDNIAGTEGGGANFPSGSVTYTINNSLIRGNVAAVNGGGIALGPGFLLINNSTLADNRAKALNSGGGGLSVEEGSATITNSTFSGNRTDGVGGGGIALITSNWTGALEIRNSTITNNQAPNGNGGGVAGLSSLGLVSFSSSIIAGNSGTISRDLAFLNPTAIGGNNNLIGANDTSNVFLAGINDPLLVGTEASPVDPGLYPLANNGGPTPTHALRVGSKALNAGNDDFLLGTDQRGGSFLRVLGGQADIGAFEGTLVVPIAQATLPNVPPAGVDYVATVVYQDETGINLSTIDTTDVTLSGPGYAMPVAPFKVETVGSGKLVTANYFFAPPGGSWDAADNGRYTLTLVGVVSDTDVPSNSVVTGALGTFSVDMGRTFVVDITADEDDGNYGAGDLSLREAVRLANASYGRNDTITFSPTVFAAPQTILLTLGEMVIEESVAIIGPGKGLLTIDANSASRHFKLDGSGVIDVSISNLTLTKGSQTGSAVLSVAGSILSFNENLTLSNVVMSSNKASTDGGAIHVLGNPNLTIIDSTINGNTANRGAGVSLNSNAAVSITRTTISGNTATDDGAGLYFFDSGSLLLDSSTLSGNTANTSSGSGLANSAGGGGAIYFFGGVEIGGFTIVNSTISGNKSTNSRGGGIVLQVFTGKAVIRNSTITDNDGKMGGGIMFARPTGLGSLTLESSIVAVNKAGGVANNALADLTHEFPDNVGGNNNLIGIMDPSNNVTLTGTGNLTGMVGSAFNPLLGPLANNGGPVFTHALLKGSPAIDTGNKGSLTVDARGVARPQDFTAVPNGAGDGSDIGAYELALPPTVAKIEINDGAVQRSLVKTIKVTFSEAVSFPMGLAAAFEVAGIGNGASGAVMLDITQSGPSVTITFKTGGVQDIDPGNSLKDGDYRLTIFANRVQGLGGTLDGNNNQESQGSPIDNRTLEFHRLFGDADGNRAVTATDFNAFRLDYGLTGPSIFDFNGDNQVSAADFNEFRLRYGVTFLP